MCVCGGKSFSCAGGVYSKRMKNSTAGIEQNLRNNGVCFWFFKLNFTSFGHVPAGVTLWVRFDTVLLWDCCSRRRAFSLSSCFRSSMGNRTPSSRHFSTFSCKLRRDQRESTLIPDSCGLEYNVTNKPATRCWSELRSPSIYTAFVFLFLRSFFVYLKMKTRGE